jgi:serine protease Do
MPISTSKKLFISAFLIVVLGACATVQLPRLSSSNPPAAVPAVTQAPAATAAPLVVQAAPQTAPVISNSALPEEQAFTSIYQAVNPSVVHIRVVLKTSSSSNPIQQFQFPQNPNLPGSPTPGAPQNIPDQAIGSGFVYDKQGYIITNDHVVADASKIIVTFYDGTEAAATLVGADPDSDLAVIKVTVDPSMLNPVTLGNSDALKVGQMVVAIGNPYGLQNSMSTGIVSGLGRMLASANQSNNSTNSAAYNIPDIIQTDAAINPGNSGGPLLDLSGEVVGVTSAIETTSGSNSGVGYAIPSAIIQQEVTDLIQNGHFQHTYIGISGLAVSADIAKAMKIDPNQRGVLIVSVTQGGPAEKAGIQGSSTDITIDGLPQKVGGDIIVGINNQPVKVFDDLLGYVVMHTKVGDTVTLHVLRNGKLMDVSLVMGARPASS